MVPQMMVLAMVKQRGHEHQRQARHLLGVNPDSPNNRNRNYHYLL